MAGIEPSTHEYPKTIVLADGAHLLLRPATIADDPARRALLARLPAAERWFGDGEPAATGPRALAVLALDGERVVAEARLARPDAEGRRHLGTLHVVLDPDYRGRRLGTWLLLDCVHLAAALGVTRLLAEVRVEDREYLAALRRLDFIEEAVLPDRYRNAEGSPEAAVLMTKVLHAAWTSF